MKRILSFLSVLILTIGVVLAPCSSVYASSSPGAIIHSIAELESSYVDKVLGISTSIKESSVNYVKSALRDLKDVNSFNDLVTYVFTYNLTVYSAAFKFGRDTMHDVTMSYYDYIQQKLDENNINIINACLSAYNDNMAIIDSFTSDTIRLLSGCIDYYNQYIDSGSSDPIIFPDYLYFTNKSYNDFKTWAGSIGISYNEFESFSYESNFTISNYINTAFPYRYTINYWPEDSPVNIRKNAYDIFLTGNPPFNTYIAHQSYLDDCDFMFFNPVSVNDYYGSYNGSISSVDSGLYDLSFLHNSVPTSVNNWFNVLSNYSSSYYSYFNVSGLGKCSLDDFKSYLDNYNSFVQPGLNDIVYDDRDPYGSYLTEYFPLNITYFNSYYGPEYDSGSMYTHNCPIFSGYDASHVFGDTQVYFPLIVYKDGKFSFAFRFFCYYAKIYHNPHVVPAINGDPGDTAVSYSEYYGLVPSDYSYEQTFNIIQNGEPTTVTLSSSAIPYMYSIVSLDPSLYNNDYYVMSGPDYSGTGDYKQFYDPYSLVSNNGYALGLFTATHNSVPFVYEGTQYTAATTSFSPNPMLLFTPSGSTIEEKFASFADYYFAKAPSFFVDFSSGEFNIYSSSNSYVTDPVFIFPDNPLIPDFTGFIDPDVDFRFPDINYPDLVDVPDTDWLDILKLPDLFKDNFGWIFDFDLTFIVMLLSCFNVPDLNFLWLIFVIALVIGLIRIFAK